MHLRTPPGPSFLRCLDTSLFLCLLYPSIYPSIHPSILIMKVLRFVAHYHGATLLTTSSTDASLKESFRSHMTGKSAKQLTVAVAAGAHLKRLPLHLPLHLHRSSSSMHTHTLLLFSPLNLYSFKYSQEFASAPPLRQCARQC